MPRQFTQKIQNESILWSNNPTSRYIAQRTEIKGDYAPRTEIRTSKSSVAHNTHEMEPIQISTDG
jgi:hypothetical protein